jgi:hypothetical protein
MKFEDRRSDGNHFAVRRERRRKWAMVCGASEESALMRSIK